MYTTIRELGPKMPYYRRNYGSRFPNGCICGPSGYPKWNYIGGSGYRRLAFGLGFRVKVNGSERCEGAQWRYTRKELEGSGAVGTEQPKVLM